MPHLRPARIPGTARSSSPPRIQPLLPRRHRRQPQRQRAHQQPRPGQPPRGLPPIQQVHARPQSCHSCLQHLTQTPTKTRGRRRQTTPLPTQPQTPPATPPTAAAPTRTVPTPIRTSRPTTRWHMPTISSPTPELQPSPCLAQPQAESPRHPNGRTPKLSAAAPASIRTPTRNSRGATNPARGVGPVLHYSTRSAPSRRSPSRRSPR